MMWFKKYIILGSFLSGSLFAQTIPSQHLNECTGSKDHIQELRSAFPELLQTDLDRLFEQNSETFAKLQVFAENLAKHDQYVITSKNLQTFLSATNLKNFSRYLVSPEFGKRLEKMQDDNPILVALAKKWIRNAAFRVFANPLRSFIELVVNACDATIGPDKTVGKFGMGFFSILSFLSHQETDGTIIEIKTISKSNLRGEGLFAYSMIFEKNVSSLDVWDDLNIRFSQIKDGELNEFLHELKPSYKLGNEIPTGTIVTITPKNLQKKFSDKTLNTLKNYICYLADYRWVPIFLNDYLEPINNNGQNFGNFANFPVNVFVTPKKLKIVDRGVGIGLSTALSSLIVPSSSTKSQITSSDFQPDTSAPHFVNLPYKNNSSQSHFLISVNGVTVVDRIIADCLKDETGKIIDLKIEMPQSTKLTLARDEILISEDGKSHEEAFIKSIIIKTIRDVLARVLTRNYLTALYDGLLAWESQNAARYVKGRFTNFFKQTLQEQLYKDESIIPVPLDHSSTLIEIFKHFAEDKNGMFLLVPVDGKLINYNFSRFESVLVELANNKIYRSFDEKIVNLVKSAIDYRLISGIRVFFVPNKYISNVSMLGMQTMLFVPEHELFDFANISENIVGKCTELDLTSYDKQNENTYNVSILMSTFSNEPVKGITQNQIGIIDKHLAEQFLKSYPVLLKIENKKLRGVFADHFILNLLGILPPSENIDLENHLNLILISVLSNFGATPKNLNSGQLYFVGSSAKLEKLWPLDEVSAENLAKLFLAFVWYLVNNSDLCFSENTETLMNARDYFLRLFYREIADHLNCIRFESVYGQTFSDSKKTAAELVIKPFEFLGFCLRPADKFGYNLVNLTKPVSIERKGATQSALQNEVQALLKFVSPAVNYDQTLKFACKDFDLVNAFTHLFLIRNCMEKNIVDKNVQVMILNLLDVISGFYFQYCNIPENEFQKVYGSKNKIHTINPTPQVDASMIVDMLNALCCKQKSFARVLQLQIDDFAKQTDVLLRSVELVQKKLYLPIVTSNTVLSTLAKFFYSMPKIPLDRKLEIASLIIDTSQNAQDFIFVIHIFMVESNLQLFNDNLSKLNDEQFKLFVAQIKDLVQRYIHEKVDEFTILEFYEKCRDAQFVSLENRLQYLADMPVTKLVYEYLKCILVEQDSLDIQAYSDKITTLTKNVKVFTLRKLMRAHFKGRGLKNELQNNNLKPVLKKVDSVQVPVNSWKITQAVEVGSQRDCIEAASIECLQNSVDAIKGFFRKLKYGQDKDIVQNFELRTEKSSDLYSIKFDLGLVSDCKDSKAQILLTIRDFIGMPSLETLLADLVLPDYSKKTSAYGNIGDMGNGTFKIYQAAESVTITTRLISNPSKIFILNIVPHRNDYGMVDDLYLKCIQNKPVGDFENFWGTKFEILFREKSRSDALIDIIAAKDFLKNCIGSTNVLVEKQNKKIDVYLKNEIINNISEDDLLYQHKVGERVLFKVYQRKNGLMQSYVTTGGVPFRSVGPLAQEMSLLPKNFISSISNGLIINFELGTYQPVQSRTRLGLTEEILKNFKECLFEVFYIFTLDQCQNNQNFLGSIFTHYNSKICNFEQLKLNGNEKKAFMDYMDSFLNEKFINNFLDKRMFFCFYKSSEATKKFDQQQKSFFDFINKEFENGLVKHVIALRTKYQSIISKAFADANLADQEYEKLCKDQKSKFKMELNELLTTWKSKILDANYTPAKLVKKVIIPWFESKIQNIDLEIHTRGNDKKISEVVAKYKNNFTSYDLKEIRCLLDAILTGYVNVYFKLNKLTNKIPEILMKKCPPGELGYFSSSSNQIIISPCHKMLVTNTLKMLQALIHGQYHEVKNNMTYEVLFSIRKGANCGVVIHELEHASTQTNHSYHDADFEDKAKHRVINIISELYSEWSKESIKLLRMDKDTISAKINKNIEVIAKLEAENQDALFDLLGV